MRLQDEHRVDRRQRALAAFLLLFACEDSAVYLDGTPQPCVIETDVETCESSYVPVWHNVYGRTVAHLDKFIGDVAKELVNGD